MNRPECYDLEIESVEFSPPIALPTGEAVLVIQVKIVDARGNIVLDAHGHRPPVTLKLFSEGGTVTPLPGWETGQTDIFGDYRAKVFVNNETPYKLLLSFEAEYQFTDAEDQLIGSPLIAKSNIYEIRRPQASSPPPLLAYSTTMKNLEPINVSMVDRPRPHPYPVRIVAKRMG